MLCLLIVLLVFFFKQKTAYEMRISDWSSDVCSSDLRVEIDALGEVLERLPAIRQEAQLDRGQREFVAQLGIGAAQFARDAVEGGVDRQPRFGADHEQIERVGQALADRVGALRSEEHTSELQSLMRISYAVFCLKKKMKKH